MIKIEEKLNTELLQKLEGLGIASDGEAVNLV